MRVEIFTNNESYRLQNAINIFINTVVIDRKGKIIDIKYSHSTYRLPNFGEHYSAMVIWEETHNER